VRRPATPVKYATPTNQEECKTGEYLKYMTIFHIHEVLMPIERNLWR
jgi:hypothetical protein